MFGDDCDSGPAVPEEKYGDTAYETSAYTAGEASGCDTSDSGTVWLFRY